MSRADSKGDAQQRLLDGHDAEQSINHAPAPAATAPPADAKAESSQALVISFLLMVVIGLGNKIFQVRFWRPCPRDEPCATAASQTKLTERCKSCAAAGVGVHPDEQLPAVHQHADDVRVHPVQVRLCAVYACFARCIGCQRLHAM